MRARSIGVFSAGFMAFYLFIYFCLECCLILAASLRYIGDPESFLFSIVNPSGGPRKLPLKSSTLGGIRCQERVAPSFGSEDYYDLKVENARELRLQVTVELGYGYNCPEDKDKSVYFTGKRTTIIDEMEVFEVSSFIG